MKKLPLEVRQTLSDEVDFYLKKVDDLDAELLGEIKSFLKTVS